MILAGTCMVIGFGLALLVVAVSGIVEDVWRYRR